LPVGARPPVVELASLEGESATLGADCELDTLVLFWNPDCGFCRAMHEDLLAWEAGVNGSGPRLVVVSSGDSERTREDGFRSTVLLDPEFSAGDVFGAGGTPSAIVLDASGRVASGVAVGAKEVLGLANSGARSTPAAVASRIEA
jgi:thiol-disulfide isomerase/thioredoxin